MHFLNEDTIIIADFHIDLYDIRFKYIKKFFEEIVSNFKNIIILGDFFEFFYSFPEVIPNGYLDLIFLLKKFSKNRKIYFIEGNHDFNLRNFFNITTFPERFFFEFNNEKYLAIHGDTVDINDRKYQYLRKFLRSVVAKFLMDNLPPYIVIKIAKHLSSSSEKYLRKKMDSNYFKNFFKKSKILNEDFKYLLSGHFHINDEFEVNGKKIFLLAGINENIINYIHLSNKGVEFKKWKF